MNDIQLTEHFNLKEFECTHPSHNHVKVDSRLVYTLEELRQLLGVPLVINSAYRCPLRNKQVGGSKNSFHMKGMAVDISLHTIKQPIKTIEEVARELGIDGVGLYNTFIHLDTRGYYAEWDNR